jgi:hypothetical protein
MVSTQISVYVVIGFYDSKEAFTLTKFLEKNIYDFMSQLCHTYLS